MSGPRYTIFQADAVFDRNLSDLQVRVLSVLGTHTDNNGWCEVNQRKLAEAVGRTRETINRVIRDLCEMGYLSKKDQTTSANGRTISLYQVLMDRAPNEPPVAPPVSPTSQPPVIEEDHNGCEPIASQLNDPSLNESSPQPPLAGGLEFASLWEAWPIEARGRHDNAQGSWSKLSQSEQEAALRAAPVAAMVFRCRKKRLPALVRFVRERLFVEFDNAPPTDFDGYFVIKPGMPEWSACLGELRKKHGERGVESAVRTGFQLRFERWPVGHPNHVAMPARERA